MLSTGVIEREPTSAGGGRMSRERENMVEPIKVGRFIAQNRKNLNLTQKELAEKLGVTDRAVSKWENGRSIPDVGIIESLCKELNISIGEFFAGEKIQEKEYKKETEKMLLASLDEKQLYGVQIVIYILEFVSLELFMLPFQLSEKWPSINRINIIYWILAAVVFSVCVILIKKCQKENCVIQINGYRE